MPLINSPHWEFSLDLCTKHCTRLPCAECLAAEDIAITVQFTEYDMVALAHHPDITIKQLLPPPYSEWMYPRMIN